MSRGRLLLLLLAAKAVLVTVALLVVGTTHLPLGVPGEWTWKRIASADQDAPWLILGGLASLAYAAFAAAGMRALSGAPSTRRTLAWVVALGPIAMLSQVAMMTAAPSGYGLAKWTTLGMPAASGYLDLARDEVADRSAFWAAYPEWIRKQDALHIGTHPPGLIILADVVLDDFARHPAKAKAVVSRAPSGVEQAFRTVLGPRPASERAAMIVGGLIALVASSLAVWPIFAMARAGGDVASSWASAAVWPLVPAALLFQPTADTAYPFLAAMALALALWSRRAGLAWAVASGAVLALGMQFSLVFLAVGFVVALALLEPGPILIPWARRGVGVLATGLGFVAITAALWALSGANPISIWFSNAQNHARFYEEFTRSYFLWVMINPIELAIALGLPLVVWIVFAGFRRRLPWEAVATLATLALLTITGRNLSEVARLWLPFLPALVVASGRGIAIAGGRPLGLSATVLLLALQTLGLQRLIQVVYPV